MPRPSTSSDADPPLRSEFGDSQTLSEGHINQGNGSIRFLAATPGPKPLPPPKVFSPRIPSPGPSPLPADSPPLASQGLRSRSPVGSPEQPSPACQPPLLALQRPPRSPRLPLHYSARTSAPACYPGSHCSLLGAKSIGSVATLPSTSHWLSWGRDLSAELSHASARGCFPSIVFTMVVLYHHLQIGKDCVGGRFPLTGAWVKLILTPVLCGRGCHHPILQMMDAPLPCGRALSSQPWPPMPGIPLTTMKYPRSGCDPALGVAVPALPLSFGPSSWRVIYHHGVSASSHAKRCSGLHFSGQDMASGHGGGRPLHTGWPLVFQLCLLKRGSFAVLGLAFSSVNGV